VSASTNQAYAPQWAYPRCGVRFGFGNRLVSFGGGSLIKVHHKQVQPSLAQRIYEFDQALETVDIAQILDQKIAQAQNDFDKMEFTVMKCIHKTQYGELLRMFGFDKKRTLQEVERYLGRKLARPNQEQTQTSS